MRKHINSATEQYQDEYTDNWVLDDTPTEGSFNAVTSDGVAKAIAEGGGGSSYTAGDGIDITSDIIKVDLASNKGLEFAQSTQTTFTADYQGYDLGQWGYMGIGPLHKTADGLYYQLDFRVMSENYLAWNVANGTEYYIFAYEPQDSTKYAICNVAYQADIVYSSVVGIGYYGGGAYEHRYTADPANWDFFGGLDPNDLDNAAFGIFFPNTSGSSPMGTDYAAVGASLLQNIGYSTTTVLPDAGKLQVKVDGSTIQVNANGGLTAVSPIPAFDPSTDAGKVLQVQSGGTLAWVSLN